MRQKRAKAYRKLMNLYSISFGFRQPYQVLGSVSHIPTNRPGTHKNHPVDSEICKSAVTQKLDLQKQLYSVLQGEVKPSGSPFLWKRMKKPLITQMAKPLFSDHTMLHTRIISARQRTAGSS